MHKFVLIEDNEPFVGFDNGRHLVATMADTRSSAEKNFSPWSDEPTARKVDIRDLYELCRTVNTNSVLWVLR